jgi:hypothetical protein
MAADGRLLEFQQLCKLILVQSRSPAPEPDRLTERLLQIQIRG